MVARHSQASAEIGTRCTNPNLARPQEKRSERFTDDVLRRALRAPCVPALVCWVRRGIVEECKQRRCYYTGILAMQIVYSLLKQRCQVIGEPERSVDGDNRCHQVGSVYCEACGNLGPHRVADND